MNTERIHWDLRQNDELLVSICVTNWGAKVVEGICSAATQIKENESTDGKISSPSGQHIMALYRRCSYLRVSLSTKFNSEC